MRAVQVVRLDGPEALEVADVADPPRRDDQVLVEVHAAGVTFPDVLLTRGEYQVRPPLPFVPGSEVAGVVLEAPPEASVRPGDRVAAFCFLNGFAERVAVDADAVFPLPERMPFTVGACIPMNYLTMHFALLRRGQLHSGETVLVHGAGGGLGIAAVQLAKALGARVLAVVSTTAKAKAARSAGADEVVEVDGFLAAVRELTGGRGVDMVVDPVGGDRFTDSLRSLAPEGRLLVLGFTAGEIPTVKVNRLLLNNIDVRGVGWGAFALGRPHFLQQQWRELMPHLEAGLLEPPVGSVYPLHQAAEAVTELAERRAVGKVVLALR